MQTIRREVFVLFARSLFFCFIFFLAVVEDSTKFHSLSVSLLYTLFNNGQAFLVPISSLSVPSNLFNKGLIEQMLIRVDLILAQHTELLNKLKVTLRCSLKYVYVAVGNRLFASAVLVFLTTFRAGSKQELKVLVISS